MMHTSRLSDTSIFPHSQQNQENIQNWALNHPTHSYYSNSAFTAVYTDFPSQQHQPQPHHQHDQPQQQHILKSVPRQHTASPNIHYAQSNLDSYNFNNYSFHSIASPPSMPLSRTLAPEISIQKPSNPVSPVTNITSFSIHSTPSPSPLRSGDMSHRDIINNDFTLFDQSALTHSQIQTCEERVHRHSINTESLSSDGDDQETASNATNYDGGLASHYTTSPFPIIVSNDSTNSNLYQDVNLYNYANLAGADASLPMYNATPNQRTSNVNELEPTQSLVIEKPGDEDDVPALSPNPAQTLRRSSPMSTSSIDTSKTGTISEHNRNDADDIKPSSNTPSLYLHTPVPKLGRTYSDAVQDELYNPGLIQRSEYIPQKSKKATLHKSSLSSSVMAFPDLFQEAQQQHQHDMAKTHPKAVELSRERSPFRANSPFHPGRSTFVSNYGAPQPQNTPKVKERVVAANYAKAEDNPADANTISPRDALFDYTETEGDASQAQSFAPLQHERCDMSTGSTSSNDEPSHQSSQSSDMDDRQSPDAARQNSFAASSMASQHDYRSQQLELLPYAPKSSLRDQNGTSSTSSTEIPMQSVAASQVETFFERPSDTRANTGTYTCTYSGCGQRFTTSAKLQKHRRDTHRKSPASQTSVSTAAAIASRNAQPGPHRCMRPNANGKPCNSVFSRPYDLTRHEDTIHNSRKEKVRCEICNDEKTFSRPDALVRHRRVKHGIN